MRCLANGVGAVGFLRETILVCFATRVWSMSVLIVGFRCFTLWKLKRRREDGKRQYQPGTCLRERPAEKKEAV
nr:MAG TPA: hypothetical protein [Caudoviricetes sp.]